MTFAARNIGLTGGFAQQTLGPFTTGGTRTPTVGWTSCRIRSWGAGGGGSRDVVGGSGTGGNSGAYSELTTTNTAIVSFVDVIGNGGNLKTVDGNGNPGTAATTVTATGIAMTANAGAGGQQSGTPLAAATASGGSINTSGNIPAVSSVLGSGAPNGGGSAAHGVIGTTPGGGGGGEQTAGNSGAGAPGQTQYDFT